jgi:hypothetical protein
MMIRLARQREYKSTYDFEIQVVDAKTDHLCVKFLTRWCFAP